MSFMTAMPSAMTGMASRLMAAVTSALTMLPTHVVRHGRSSVGRMLLVGFSHVHVLMGLRLMLMVLVFLLVHCLTSRQRRFSTVKRT